MIKIYSSVLLIILVSFSAQSQKPPVQLNWLNTAQLYLNGGDFNSNAVTNLSDGSVVTVGYFENTVDFDPGPDTFNVSAVSYQDIFIAKYSNQGKLVFSFGFGGIRTQLFEAATSITTDADDNIYVTGYFSSTVDFDPGTGKAVLVAPESSTNNFIACYDKNGKFKFAKNITDCKQSSTYQSANSITIDKYKNIYVTGNFYGDSVDFDPGINNTAYTSFKNDIFIAKYDSTGNFLFVKVLGGKDYDYANKIILDKNNNILICGNFYSNFVDFDPDSAKHILYKKSNQEDLFFAKYDSAGNFIFAKNVGNLKFNVATGIAVGTDNSFVITGSFYGTSVDFDISNPGEHVLNSNGISDAFVAKYNNTGKCVFAFNIGNASGSDDGVDIGLDANNNIFCTGSFGGKSVDFDPDSSIYNISTAHTGNYYIAKYSYNGKLLSSIAIGTNYAYNFKINCLHVTNSGKTLTSGFYKDTIDANAGPDSAILITPSETMFVCKYDNDNNFLGVISGNNYLKYTYSTTQTYSSALDNAGNVYVCGKFSGRFDFDPGSGVTILASPDNYYNSGFYAKYSSTGKLIFAKAITGGGISANDIALDNNGNIYLAGIASGNTDFDPANSVYYLNNKNAADLRVNFAYFFAKYNSDGNLIFAKGGGNGTGYYLNVTSLALDKKNNICIGGTIDDPIDFDPGPDEHIISGRNSGIGDIFLAKYDSVGNYTFAYSIKSVSSSGAVSDLKFDKKGNIIITGIFNGNNLDFDPGPGKFLLSSNGTNSGSGFISVYKNNGNFVSAIAINGQDYYSKFTSLTTDDKNNIYIAGSTTYFADFDPGPGIASITDLHEIFFASYNSKLQLRFLKGLLSNGDYHSEGNNVNAICLDENSNIYIAGEYSSSYIDCNPSSDSAFLINNKYIYCNNLFIAKYDSLGNYIYSNQFVSDTINGSNLSTSILVDHTGVIYYSGTGRGKINFATGNKKVYLQPTSRYNNMFVTQYRQTDFITSTLNVATVKAVTNTLVKVYPNPIKDHINIQLSNITQNNSIATISLFDMNGKCLQTNQTSFSNHNLNTTLKLPQNLSAGNYFIKVNVEGKTYYSNALIK